VFLKLEHVGARRCGYGRDNRSTDALRAWWLFRPSPHPPSPHPPNPLAAQRVALGVTSGGEYFGSKIITPTIAESVLGTVAGGIFSEFTVGKLILDAATYGVGLATCSLKDQ
jgi:hypothetical protein